MKLKKTVSLILVLLCTLSTGFLVSAEAATAITDRPTVDILEKIERPIFPGIEILPPREPNWEINPDGPSNDVPEIDIPEYSFPSEYCMRDEYIVYAQNQDKHGLCWNFAAMMSASTAIMKATNEYYDFSELWSTVALYNCSSSYNKIGAGGHFSYNYDSIKTSGLMLESDLPFQNSYTVSNENADDYYNFYGKYANDDLVSSLYYDSSQSYSRKNVDEIKNHIYNYGSVYMAFSFKTGFIENDGVYRLTPNQTNTNSNHAISVIGWDDNYEQEFYLNGSDTPTVFKGAWIVLNSYTETNGNDGISMIFYEDNNIYDVKGYKYSPDTTRDLYFYDKIESGYAYPTSVKGKYCGNFTAEEGLTKQKNIFYDDVDLEYSYIASSGTVIEEIDIYLGNRNVTDLFSVRIDNDDSRFYVSADNVAYGNYKMLVTYGNGEKSDTYLNNFFVTHGLFGEEIEYNCELNDLAFNTGRDMEFYSFTPNVKNYVIYTNKLSGTVSFLPTEQSVYSEHNMSIPDISYEITDGVGCTKTYTITSATGYELSYNFRFEYYEDTSLQPVFVFYDLGGGVNSAENYNKELASSESGMVLHAPTRQGYTFKGWYLDYGNSSRAVEKIGDLYYVSWDDIHHMGESPTMSASSYYQKYYKNSNVVFLYARWVEDDYYDVDINITGNGTTNLGNKVTLCSEDSVKCLFTPSSGWCLSKIEFDGVPLSPDELLNVMNNGLVLENVDKNTNISVTFSEGVYLYIKHGDNIKNAYLTKNYKGEIVKFYNGECIPPTYLGATYANYFNLVVEVFDDKDGFTYVLDDVSTYYALGKGMFTKELSIYKSAKVREITVGSAVAKPIQKVLVNYTVGSYVLDHYISADVNAKGGSKLSSEFNAGEVAYLFVKIKEDTHNYYYTLTDEYESIGEQWYRAPIYVNADKPSIGRVQPLRNNKVYVIKWMNWDGSVIYEDEYYYGDNPIYFYEDDEGKNIYPSKPDDVKYSYKFAGWDPVISVVNENKCYTPVFIAVPKQYTVNVEASENGSVIAPCESNSINCLDVHTYIIAPNDGYKIKDVTVNGVSVGAVLSYTFKNVSSDQSLKVEFEPKSFSITLNTAGKGRAKWDKSLQNVTFGEDRVITLSANIGWKISSVFVNGERVDSTNPKLLLDNITEDTDVLAVYEQDALMLNFALASLSVLLIISVLSLIFVLIRKRRAKAQSPLKLSVLKKVSIR